MFPKKIQLMMRYVLSYGTMLSAFFVTLGGVLHLIKHGNQAIQTEFFQTDAYEMSINQIWHVALSFSPIGCIELGLILLVMMQVFRVIILAWFYLSENDYTFSLISSFILFVLIYSLFWRN